MLPDLPAYTFELVGSMALFMHHDDVELSDEVQAWRNEPANKSVRKPGDDRSPPWTWQTYLYHDGELLAIPQGNIMSCLRYAGARITARGKTTFKGLSQSGLLITSDFCSFLNNGKSIAIEDILAFRNEPFAAHRKRALALGFELDVRRAPVQSSKHVRVRARFANWSITGSIRVLDAAITTEKLQELFMIGGKYAGLGDWRPSSPKSPGPFGTFTVKIAAVNAAAEANQSAGADPARADGAPPGKPRRDKARAAPG